MMKQDDFFKKYIEERREEFEDEELPSDMFSKILQKKENRRYLKKHRVFFFAAAAACVLLLLNSVFLLQNPKPVKYARNTSLINTLNKRVPLEEINSKDQILAEELTSEKPSEMPVITKELSVKPPKVYSTSNPTSKQRVYRKNYNQMLAGLAENGSVSDKMNAILNAAEYKYPDENLKYSLRTLFANDENSNVRLAALHLLANQLNDSTTREYLIEGLSDERDPVIQMELVRIMRNDGDSAVTEKLVQMANYPFTIQEVKDQVYYALLTR